MLKLQILGHSDADEHLPVRSSFVETKTCKQSGTAPSSLPLLTARSNSQQWCKHSMTDEDRLYGQTSTAVSSKCKVLMSLTADYANPGNDRAG